MKPEAEPSKIISISALDSFGAAGLAADIRMGSYLGVHVFPVITSITAQNHRNFLAQQPVNPSLLIQQLKATIEGCSGPIAAIKIGMLGDDPEAIIVLARFLDQWPGFKILDTPFISSSGSPLLSTKSIKALVTYLLPVVDIITPNVLEAQTLVELLKGQRYEDVPSLAESIVESGKVKGVLVTGGNKPIQNQSGQATARDYFLGSPFPFWLDSPFEQKEMRGTGDQFALATAVFFSRGHELCDAFILAKASINSAIRQAPKLGEKYVSFFQGKHPIDASTFPSAFRDSCPQFRFPQEDRLGFYAIVPDIAWFRKLAEAGVKLIQLRLKDIPSAQLEGLVLEAQEIAHAYGVKFYLNDYWQLALKHGIYGVHLGQEDLIDADLFALAEAGIRLGISTHSYLEAAIARGIAPSYCALGPIFPTTCKSMAFGPQGIEKIKIWKSILPYPIVAIGGIKRCHAAELAQAGADGIALISDLTHAEDFDARVKEWLAIDAQYF